MKALTLYQPWATLVAIGEKTIETRSWPTKHRGFLLIHAAAEFPVCTRGLCALTPFAEALAKHNLQRDDLPTGKILAIADLVDCIPTGDLRGPLPPNERAFGDYRPGRYAWFLRGVRVVFDPPIPAKGNRRLWNYRPNDPSLFQNDYDLTQWRGFEQ